MEINYLNQLVKQSQGCQNAYCSSVGISHLRIALMLVDFKHTE